MMKFKKLLPLFPHPGPPPLRAGEIPEKWVNWAALPPNSPIFLALFALPAAGKGEPTVRRVGGMGQRRQLILKVHQSAAKCGWARIF
jgi:hypothetical protein